MFNAIGFNLFTIGKSRFLYPRAKRIDRAAICPPPYGIDWMKQTVSP
ncbi:hypothetical protein L810_2099 [Burkholderia sp. AU4i]|nr:hypothetical protein L810_2099 [Burkholderia sp. AU4i]